MDVYIGFDSAWANNPKARGAICAVEIDVVGNARFHQPRPVSFNQALSFIREVRSDTGATIVALDQPTVVPNLTGMRPVERVGAALVVQSRREAVWIGFKALGFFLPARTDELKGSETGQSFEAFGEVVSVKEGGEMLP